MWFQFSIEIEQKELMKRLKDEEALRLKRKDSQKGKKTMEVDDEEEEEDEEEEGNNIDVHGLGGINRTVMQTNKHYTYTALNFAIHYDHAVSFV